MTKKKKIILSISSLLLMLILYGWFFGFQTHLALFTRFYLSEPGYSMTPQPIETDVSSDPASMVKAFDYGFSVPWTELSELYSSTSMVSWATQSTNIIVTCFLPEVALYSGMIGSSEGDEERHRAFKSALGLKGVTHTNYYLFSKMWNTTPQDISIFKPRSEAVIQAFFLMCKAIAAPSVTPGGIYCFETDHVKGVQVGDPSRDRSVHLSIFDRLDREIRVTIGHRSDSLRVVSQADINTIITTFTLAP